jgi:Nitroreductase
MKKTVFLLAAMLVMSTSMYSQDLKEVKLNAPNKSRGAAVMKALSDRQSVREYDAKEISLQDLSDLLWATVGINRPDGKRTAPTAVNAQEIDIYVVRQDGAYLYDAKAHSLKPVAKGDFRKAVAGGQDFVNAAPLCLVIVANLEKMGDSHIAAIDAGIAGQNINIFCAAVGLSTVPRASWDKGGLEKALKLSDKQRIFLNNPVGYPKK